MTRNYRYFLKRIAEMPITGDQLFDAVKRLKVVDVKLDEHDDAQRVFESLNSTGLDLTEADKIRNFILMDLAEREQERCYEEYWIPIERNTLGQVSDFVRYYLAAKMVCFVNLSFHKTASVRFTRQREDSSRRASPWHQSFLLLQLPAHERVFDPVRLPCRR